MEPRLKLDALLRNVLRQARKAENLYFQPPSGYRLKYPCIVYSESRIQNRHASPVPADPQRREHIGAGSGRRKDHNGLDRYLYQKCDKCRPLAGPAPDGGRHHYGGCYDTGGQFPGRYEPQRGAEQQRTGRCSRVGELHRHGRFISWAITDETIGAVIQFFFDRMKAALES